MNFVFVSPQFPTNYWAFCVRLRELGVDVYGIGDAPYDSLDPRLRESLGEYFRVDDGTDYEQAYRAMAYLAWKHGRPAWVESNNEFWLETDARLRTDFHVTTGVDERGVVPFKSKSAQKALYAKAGVPTAEARPVRERGDIARAVEELGLPLIAKPDVGVGAAGTRKLASKTAVRRFEREWQGEPYLLERFVRADAIYSYDAIFDSHAEPLFESSFCFPPSIMDVAQKGLDLAYHVYPVSPELARIGRAMAKEFGARQRFVHFEFFRLASDQPGLGEKGSLVGLEANMRPAGGISPDMMNWAHGCDVYRVWAEMVAFDERRDAEPDAGLCCAYAARRDGHAYAHTADEVLVRFADNMRLHERVPDALADDLGNEAFVALFDDERQARRFTRYVQRRQPKTTARPDAKEA